MHPPGPEGRPIGGAAANQAPGAPGRPGARGARQVEGGDGGAAWGGGGGRGRARGRARAAGPSERASGGGCPLLCPPARPPVPSPTSAGTLAGSRLRIARKGRGWSLRRRRRCRSWRFAVAAAGLRSRGAPLNAASLTFGTARRRGKTNNCNAKRSLPKPLGNSTFHCRASCFWGDRGGGAGWNLTVFICY